MSEPRFYVREVWGDLLPQRGNVGQVRGVTAHVLDRRYNCALVATYRSEEQWGLGRSAADKRATAIKRAHEHAARLNAGGQR